MWTGLRRVRLLPVLLGLASSALLLWLALQRVEWEQVRAALAEADPWPWTALGALSYLAGQVVRGARCRLLVSDDTALPLATASNVVVVGYAVNNVFPARLGELARVGLLAERSGIPLAQALSVTVLERILDAAAILALLLLATAAIGYSPLIASVVPAAAVGVGLGLAALLLLVRRPEVAVAIASRIALRMAPRVQPRVERALRLVAHGGAVLRTPRRAARVAAQSLGIWLLEAGLFLCILPVFGIPADFRWALLAMAVTNVGLLVPSSPGYVGPFHYFCMAALVSVGVAEPAALGVAIVTHATYFVPVTVWGALVGVVYGFRLGDTFAVAAAARTASGAASEVIPGGEVIAVLEPESAPGDPSRFTLALTEALTNEAVVGLEPPERRSAVAYAAGFVHGQLAALQPRMRSLYRLGTAAFRLYVRCTTLRGFCDLPPERRMRLVHQWCYGPLAPARQLFRAPRSTALLAVYELPGVLEGAAGPSRAGEPE